LPPLPALPPIPGAANYTAYSKPAVPTPTPYDITNNVPINIPYHK